MQHTHRERACECVHYTVMPKVAAVVLIVYQNHPRLPSLSIVALSCAAFFASFLASSAFSFSMRASAILLGGRGCSNSGSSGSSNSNTKRVLVYAQQLFELLRVNVSML
jgi:hypothetical protein